MPGGHRKIRLGPQTGLSGEWWMAFNCNGCVVYAKRYKPQRPGEVEKLWLR